MSRHYHTVRVLAAQLDLVPQIERVVRNNPEFPRIWETEVRYHKIGRSLGLWDPCAGYNPWRHGLIVLNPGLAKEYAREQLVDTFLHEIAHGLIHFARIREKSHGGFWRSLAAHVGAKPEACATSEVANRIIRETLKPVLRCDACDYTYYAPRKRDRERTYRHKCGRDMRHL